MSSVLYHFIFKHQNTKDGCTFDVKSKMYIHDCVDTTKDTVHIKYKITVCLDFLTFYVGVYF